MASGLHIFSPQIISAGAGYTSCFIQIGTEDYSRNGVMPSLGEYYCMEGDILPPERSVYLYDNCQFMAVLDFLHMSETSVGV